MLTEDMQELAAYHSLLQTVPQLSSKLHRCNATPAVATQASFFVLDFKQLAALSPGSA
jgi:hypothetical protein